MKTTLLLIILLIPFTLLNSQQWEQLTGEPEGGGVTDIYLNGDNGDLYVATGSLNWPSGEDGGIRKSSDDGATWTSLFDSYTARFVFMGPDGDLYAGVWDYPADEGLYRSSNDGQTWDLLTSVPTGNNIFACAIVEGSTNTIFAGTGQGILRSLDNGATWGYVNNGLPANTLVRSLAVSDDGLYIAAGTTNGCYVSSDNGENWDAVTGDVEGQTVSAVTFDYSEEKEGIIGFLYMGLEGGSAGIYVASLVTLFTVAVLVTTLQANSGITRMLLMKNPQTLLTMFMVSVYSALGGAFYYALGGTAFWQLFMTGLPSLAMISMFTATVLVTTTVALIAYVAMYGNSKESLSGSEIYKATFDLTTGIEGQPYTFSDLKLFQNIPNPFREQTRINFELPESGYTSLRIFDLAGNEIATLADGVMNRGRHSIRVDGTGLGSGMYYYVLRSKNQVESKKLVIQ